MDCVDRNIFLDLDKYSKFYNPEYNVIVLRA